MDPNKSEVKVEIAKIYDKQNKYTEAALTYEEY
jgi:hypothetical protein